MNTQQLKDAIGRDEGDYIELKNQWASVIVAIEENAVGVRDHVVSGDILDLRLRQRRFPTLSKAVAYAVDSLASYRRGSPGQN